MDDFSKWLLSELDKRNISRSDLARLSGLAPGTISNIISGKRGRSDKSLTKIARALKLPPEHVFTVAGILKSPAKKGEDPRIAEILHRAEQLDDHDRSALLEFIEMLDRMRGKRNGRK